MATYIYETIPAENGGEVRTFEIHQSMKEAPLTHDPQTGLRVRRIITGGLGIISGKRGFSGFPASNGARPGDFGCCGACHT